jgi:GMP reductase
MKIENDVKLDFSDVLIRPKRSILSSRADVDLYRQHTFKYSNTIFNSIPIIASNMYGVSTVSMARELNKHGMTVALHKHIKLPELARYYEEYNSSIFDNWFSYGITENDMTNLKNNLEYFPNSHMTKVCIDVANGYTEMFVETIKRIRENCPHLTIMAGNVVTAEMTEELILAGVDIVKLGIGPGAACTTRKITGVGYPQLSAIIECADAAHGLGGLVCADGGCQVPGDIAKAFGAGADFVMLGGMLAGHKESEQELLDEKSKIIFYGSSSEKAQQKSADGVKDYRAFEGKSIEIEYKGPVENTIKEILGGLRSACTYVGAEKLKDLSRRTTFVRVNRQLNNMFS